MQKKNHKITRKKNDNKAKEGFKDLYQNHTILPKPQKKEKQKGYSS